MKKVLVLEDESSIRGFIVINLERAGYEVVEAETGEEALEKNGSRVKLTQVEYAIVRLFMENKGKALSREEILDKVWGHGYFGEPKIVDVNMRRLRIKLEDDAQEPKYILTVWGYGYKWNIE